MLTCVVVVVAVVKETTVVADNKLQYYVSNIFEEEILVAYLSIFTSIPYIIVMLEVWRR